ncbi:MULTISPECIES: hypothetical protein [unclassified Microcella]|uniref:hypothetical protein n=1 Tax=unclassified Microcella TaxID=2630066 RepID=UPI0006FF8D6C|nr:MULTISPECIES: hypothetical protein [unclassified Microcella]KQV25193.1 hypothetical protein ASC54_12150 [Yonghaparkia sp. Root332]KRF31475.1 hypothetical protein ASG83_11955 [Yonghaparkia sp. Soil809]
MPTTIHADPSGLTLRLGWLDRVLALRGDVRIHASDIDVIAVVPDGLASVAGIRAPGLGIPGARKIGTWRRRQGATVAVVRGRGPALSITATGGPVRRIVLSAPDAAERAAALQAALAGERS